MPNSIRQVKEELVVCARRAYEIGLQTGNGGNISGRVPGTDLVVVKATGISFGECTVENLVTVNLQGEQIDGKTSPSRELGTHLVIYRERPDVYGVFHSHSPWTIACAEFVSEIPLVTHHARSKVRCIPVLDIPGHADMEVARRVGALVKESMDLRAFVQAGHGIFCLGESITRAEHYAELVEETAQVAWLMEVREYVRQVRQE